MNKAYVVPNHSGPTEAVNIDPTLCIGCNNCVNICRIQTILPNPEKGQPPVVVYPDECWYCGCCVEACPTGALEMRLPINQRVFFKDKDTGEVFRIGGAEAPIKSFFRPPYGWLSGNGMNALFQELEQGERPVHAYVSPEVVHEIGRFFGEKEPRDNGGKLASLLRSFGFTKVFLSNTVPPGEGITRVFIGALPQKADYNMDVKTLSDFLRRGCVSSYTAIHTWREIPDAGFDEP